MSDDIVDELNFYAQRADAPDRVLHLLAEAAGTIQRLRRRTPLQALNEIIASLRYDGPDENGLTVGEIRRALP